MIKLFSVILILISGCSFFTKKVESLTTENISKTKTSNQNQYYCITNNQLQFIYEDETAEKFYSTFKTKFFQNTAYSFIQKVAILSLVEMIRRPDITTPTSRFQYYLHFNNNDYYFDYFPKSNGTNLTPYLKGLDSLLKQFDNSIQLKNLAAKIDSTIPDMVNVSNELELFLKKNKSDIVKNPKLNSIYIKGNDTLTKLESYKRSSITSIIQNNNGLFKNIGDDYYQIQKPLLKMETNIKDTTVECNFEVNKDSSIKDESLTSDNNRSHYFGIKEGNNYFIGITSGNVDLPLKSYQSTNIIKTLPSQIPNPICHIKNSIQDLFIVSTKGRSPAQHLYHLLQYDLPAIDNFTGLQELLRFSRHLFLSSPDRILYESKRGRKTQLDFFLNMNFPIYHVESLGNIIGFASYKNSNVPNLNTLFLDDRSIAQLWCK